MVRARAPSSDGVPRRRQERATDMKVDIVERIDAGGPPNSNDHLLVRELAHRINNELALIVGHASLAAARSANDEVKRALAGVTRLLHHFADVNRALEMPTHSTVIDVSDYIRMLCQSIRRARLDDRGIELVLVASPLQMRSERCWKLGIIVSELITNSVRHAFDNRGGRIRIELSSAGSYVQCCVIDNGSSQSSGVPGQGLKIIEALAKELDGQIVHRFGAEGALSMLIFPLNSKAQQIDCDAGKGDWISIESPAHPS
jgi:two-component sensor histidine kinase